MTPEEIKSQLDRIQNDVTAKQQELLKAAKEQSDARVKDLETEIANAKLSHTQLAEKLDALEAKAGRIPNAGANQGKGFGEVFAETVKENFGNISRVSKGRGLELDLSGKGVSKMAMTTKTVGNMTVAANLTGESVVSYDPMPALNPANKINFRDLVGGIPLATGTYVVYRETGGEGSFGFTSAGAAKNQVDYDFTRVQYNASYLNGYVKIAKEMLQDLPFLQTYLPQMLLRDFYKKENAQYYTDLSTSASGPTTPVGANYIEDIINLVGQVEDEDYDVTGIVLKPSIVAAIQNTKPQNYSLPGAVTISNNGQLTINGVPVYKASWMATNRVLMGDWSQAFIGTVDGLKVEFFEQDGDNVTKNLITVRVEARQTLVVHQPDAFSFATIAAS